MLDRAVVGRIIDRLPLLNHGLDFLHGLGLRGTVSVIDGLILTDTATGHRGLLDHADGFSQAGWSGGIFIVALRLDLGRSIVPELAVGLARRAKSVHAITDLRWHTAVVTHHLRLDRAL